MPSSEQTALKTWTQNPCECAAGANSLRAKMLEYRRNGPCKLKQAAPWKCGQGAKMLGPARPSWAVIKVNIPQRLWTCHIPVKRKGWEDRVRQLAEARVRDTSHKSFYASAGCASRPLVSQQASQFGHQWPLRKKDRSLFRSRRDRRKAAASCPGMEGCWIKLSR